MVGKRIADADADDIFSSRFTSVVYLPPKGGGGLPSIEKKEWFASLIGEEVLLFALLSSSRRRKNFAKSIPLVSEAGVLLSSQTNKSDEEGVETCSSLSAKYETLH